MIVKCSNCGTTYNFDERLLEGQEMRLRCSRCRFVFSLVNPATTEEVASAPLDETVPAPATPMPPAGYAQDSPPEKPGKAARSLATRPAFWGVVALFVVALACGVFLLAGKDFRTTCGLNAIAEVFGKKTPPVEGAKPQEAEGKEQTAAAPASGEALEQKKFESLPAESLGKISVVMWEQKVVTGAGGQKLVMQSGKVINNTGKRLQAVKIEGRLYGNKADVVQNSTAICGNEIAVEKLQVEDRQTSLQRLALAGNSTIVEVGKDAPFQLLFYLNGSAPIGKNPYVFTRVKDAYLL